jgi:hypothetical protein
VTKSAPALTSEVVTSAEPNASRALSAKVPRSASPIVSGVPAGTPAR